MHDFETHARGTASELKILRELAREIGQEHKQFNTVSFSIMRVYNTLIAHYTQHNTDYNVQ